MMHAKWNVMILTVIILLFLPYVLAEDSCDHDWIFSYHTHRDCTHTAKDYYECSKCGATKYENVGFGWGHDWSTWTTTSEATCMHAGSKYRICSRCKEKETAEIPQLPHTIGKWEIILETTDHSAGRRSGICSVCGTNVMEDFDPDGTLRKDDEGEDVKEFQSMLYCHGYMTLDQINGKYDATTEDAVKKCQAAEGLAADGIGWPQTISRIGHQYSNWIILSEKSDFSIGRKERTCAKCGYTATLEDVPSPMMRRKDKGDNVKALQQALNNAGYNCGTVDGIYGQNTERAVMAFEKDCGLNEDGIAWPGVIKLIPGLELAGIDQYDLSLTVTQVSPVKSTYEEGEIITVEWTLANNGTMNCDYWHIDFGKSLDAGTEQILAAGTLQLMANNNNKITGKCQITLYEDITGLDISSLPFRAKGMTADNTEYESDVVNP